MALVLRTLVNGQPQRWTLESGANQLGRASGSQVQILHATVSKEHAEIGLTGDRWTVRDLGSRNGTRLNGEEVRDVVEIRPGDRLELGEVVLEVGEPQAAAPTMVGGPSIESSVRLHAREWLTSPGPVTSQNRLVTLLAEAGQLLVMPRTLRESCDEILGFVARAVPADRLVLLLRQEGVQELQPIASVRKGPYADRPLVLSQTIVDTVCRECTSVLTRDASMDSRFKGQQSIVAQGIHSAMAVPLFDNKQVLGILYSDSGDLRVAYDQQQLEILTLLANMAAVKITNQRLLEAEGVRQRMAQELATAARIQRRILPDAPDLPGYAWDARIETCNEVGGDLYDFFLRPDGRMVVLVGDVSGKGMGAALLMSSTMFSARVLYEQCNDPVDLVRRLNAVLYRSTESGHFVTLFCGFLDPATGHLEYVNAGHNPPVVLGPDGLGRLDATGPPVAIMADGGYESGTMTLPPGGSLVLYSDGIPEALRGEEFYGEERMEAHLLGAAALAPGEQAHSILREVEDFLQGHPRGDDVTLVILRRD